MADLTEIVARAIRDDMMLPAWQHERFKQTAAAVLAALHDPPPDVVEAGAKTRFLACWHSILNDYGEGEHIWQTMDQRDRNAHCIDWLASWRAALDATPPRRPESETQNTA